MNNSLRLAGIGLVVILLLLGGSQSLLATPLPIAGGDVAPSLFSTATGTQLAFQAVSFSNLYINGIVYEAVYRDPVSGFLDFYYQVKNSATSTDPVTQVTLTNWTGWDSSSNGYGAFYRTDAPTGTFGSFLTPTAVAGVQPDVARRNTDSTIGFDWADPLPAIPVGAISDVFVVKTNGPYYVPGMVSIQDGLTSNIVGYQPSSVPEPGSLILLGTGMVALAWGIKRKTR